MSSLKDLVRREYAIILDNFTNLVESFRIVNKHEEGRKVGMGEGLELNRQ